MYFSRAVIFRRIIQWKNSEFLLPEWRYHSKKADVSEVTALSLSTSFQQKEGEYIHSIVTHNSASTNGAFGSLLLESLARSFTSCNSTRTTSTEMQRRMSWMRVSNCLPFNWTWVNIMLCEEDVYALVNSRATFLGDPTQILGARKAGSWRWESTLSDDGE